ncbi:MAG: hypothetical protein HYR49_03915 [Gammaproteobacteria bacterium]|nr:hypothetical protein [Gammaproteobacteria bacterium]
MGPSAEQTANGTIRGEGDDARIFYDGYWVRYYAPPGDTPAAKRALLISLARRVFHHTEPGINTPGDKLALARQAYDAETDPVRKRVNGAMLAGALFNRAIDILNVLSQLANDGVAVRQDNPIMVECEKCLREAATFGRMVKHYSGEEGIDELWGQPLQAFVMPMAEYYQSRYAKVAKSMLNVDTIAGRMTEVFAPLPEFDGVVGRIERLAAAARAESETFRSDPLTFTVWPQFVEAAEAIAEFRPCLPANMDAAARLRFRTARWLLVRGKDILIYVAGARVPMPKTTREYLERCDAFTRGDFELN